jgi:pyruvate-formate lyase-activating enzyme
VYAKKYTDQDINIKNIKKIISKLIFMERFEILPLHILAKEKYKSLGIKYKMNKENIPNSKEIENLKNFLDDKRVF